MLAEAGAGRVGPSLGTLTAGGRATAAAGQVTAEAVRDHFTAEEKRKMLLLFFYIYRPIFNFIFLTAQ